MSLRGPLIWCHRVQAGGPKSPERKGFPQNGDHTERHWGAGAGSQRSAAFPGPLPRNGHLNTGDGQVGSVANHQRPQMLGHRGNASVAVCWQAHACADVCVSVRVFISLLVGKGCVSPHRSKSQGQRPCFVQEHLSHPRGPAGTSGALSREPLAAPPLRAEQLSNPSLRSLDLRRMNE